MNATLDVKRLPQSASIGEGSDLINLTGAPWQLRNTIARMANDGIIKSNSSFGFAAAKPAFDVMADWEWNDPYDFTYLVTGWGPEGSRFIANAVRKLRAMLRTHTDTVQLRMESPSSFQDIVESIDSEGNFPWGDYPYGGGTFVHVGHIVIPCAVSGFRELEDHTLAALIGNLMGAEYLKHNMPEMFGPKS